jgi:redox-regulated HSP33 family molecular chaperone
MDRLLRGLDADKAIRVVTAVTTGLVREAARRHGPSGAAAVLLGRGLTAGCSLAALTKRDDERVRIAVHGDGPLGRVLMDALATEQGGTEVRCNHCGDAYTLTEAELHELAAQLRGQRS